MKAAYFVHDLTDPAVGRRVRMLRTSGTDVTVLGFRRGDEIMSELDGAPAFDLGRTYDAQLGHRVRAMASWMLRAGELRERVAGAQVFIARNLEMLAIAAAVRAQLRPRPALVYECLDIHWLMLSASPAGRLARAAERRLLAGCDLLIVSSPAFLARYFEPRQRIDRLGLDRLLVENKHLDVTGEPPAAVYSTPRPAGPPWRIGWYGMIRCRKSLNILTALAARRPDLVQVEIRGRPTPAVFPDFQAEIEWAPAVRFGGAYTPEELPALYRDVHFTWAVDYYDEGRNSDMLIPNRLYESGLYGSVPIALSKVETGRWLARRGLGVLVEDPLRELEHFFETLDAEAWRRLEAQSACADPSLFRADMADCERLRAALAAVLPQPRPNDEPVSKPKPFLAPAARRALS